MKKDKSTGSSWLGFSYNWFTKLSEVVDNTLSNSNSNENNLKRSLVKIKTCKKINI